MKAFDSPKDSQQSIGRGGPEFDGRIREHSVHKMLASKAFGGGGPDSGGLWFKFWGRGCLLIRNSDKPLPEGRGEG